LQEIRKLSIITDSIACTVSIVETSTNQMVTALFVEEFPQRVAIPSVEARTLIIGGGDNNNGFVLMIDARSSIRSRQQMEDEGGS
jgi:hypothetical protein